MSELELLKQALDTATTNLKTEIRSFAKDCKDELQASRERTDAVYRERDRCVALIARLALDLGFNAWLGKHVGENWEDDWRNIVFIHLPCGQLSWHIHDSELYLFSFLNGRTGEPWDGHSTEDKYERMFIYSRRIEG